MKPLILHTAAKAEVAGAAAFFEERRKGYGEKFRAEVLAAFRQIRRSPKAFSLYKRGPARRRLVVPFGYGIYYVEEDERIFVLAVMNQRRQPDYWLVRLKDI